MSDAIEKATELLVPARPADATLGHNLNFINADGSLAREALLEYVVEAQHALVERRGELIEAFGRTPEKIDGEEVYKRFLDYNRQLGNFVSEVDADHAARKAVWLDGGKVIDNRWHELRDTIVGIRATINRRCKAFADAKAERERLERLAAQRAAEEEAARKRREAEAAEQAMMAKEEPTATDLDEAISAGDAASKAENDAAIAARAAQAKPAELARTRTELGALGTLARIWVFRDLNRETVDLEALRPHLSTDCIEKALRAFIKAGGRQITGATIAEDTAHRG